MFCVFCGGGLRASHRTCPRCGRRKPVRLRFEQGSTTCGACGKSSAPEALFCTECGQALDDSYSSVPPELGEPAGPEEALDPRGGPRPSLLGRLRLVALWAVLGLAALFGLVTFSQIATDDPTWLVGLGMTVLTLGLAGAVAAFEFSDQPKRPAVVSGLVGFAVALLFIALAPQTAEQAETASPKEARSDILSASYTEAPATSIIVPTATFSPGPTSSPTAPPTSTPTATPVPVPPRLSLAEQTAWIKTAQPQSDSGLRFLACQLFERAVTNMLKAPATAKFEKCNDRLLLYDGHTYYSMYAYVDAQNGFGALIRSNFSVFMYNSGSQMVVLWVTPFE